MSWSVNITGHVPNEPHGGLTPTPDDIKETEEKIAQRFRDFIASVDFDVNFAQGNFSTIGIQQLTTPPTPLHTPPR